MKSLAIYLQAIALLFTVGCRNFPVKMSHGPLPTSSSQRTGSIEIAPFKDTRPGQKPTAIGDAKGGLGNRLGDFVVKGGAPIEKVIEGYFAEAIRHVGYNNSSSSAAKVQLEGEVFEFWMNSGWNITVKIGVLTRIKDIETGKILWEKEIRASEDDMLSYNSAAEDTFNILLANAIREFSSLDFYEAVQRKNRRATE